MKYLSLMSGCLMLSACTTHYNDQTTIAYSGDPVVRSDLPTRSYSRDIPISGNSHVHEQSLHRQFGDETSVGDETSTKHVVQEQVVPATIHQAREPEVINQEYYSAAKKGQIDIAAARLNEGANVNYANAQGETVLHIAAVSGNYQLASSVLNSGANVNALTTGGWTALHSAARFGHLAIVDLLLQAGVDRYAMNRDGKSALDLARLMGKHDIVSKLSQ